MESFPRKSNSTTFFLPSSSSWRAVHKSGRVGMKGAKNDRTVACAWFFTSRAARKARGQLVLRLLCGFRVCIYIYVCMCVRTYHVRNNYVTYIVAMRPSTYFSRLWQFRWLLCVAAMSSLPQLRLRDGYQEAEAT